MFIRRCLVGAAVLFACAGTFSGIQPALAGDVAQAPTLTVGSFAPALTIEKWVKGSPIPTFERGRVYVVEFWATWCIPCVGNVPHLTELQKKHPNIAVIGVAASEQPSRYNNDDRLATLQKFVQKQGARMEYSIAYDGTGSMWANWMTPAQRGNIPCAFIVGPDRRISWIGNPQLDDFDKALDSVLARPETRRDAMTAPLAAKPVQVTMPAQGIKRSAPQQAASAPAEKQSAQPPTPPGQLPPRRIASGAEDARGTQIR